MIHYITLLHHEGDKRVHLLDGLGLAGVSVGLLRVLLGVDLFFLSTYFTIINSRPMGLTDDRRLLSMHCVVHPLGRATTTIVVLYVSGITKRSE